MARRVPCSACGHILNLPPQRKRTSAQCPICGKRLEMADVDSASPGKPAPPPLPANEIDAEKTVAAGATRPPGLNRDVPAAAAEVPKPPPLRSKAVKKRGRQEEAVKAESRSTQSSPPAASAASSGQHAASRQQAADGQNGVLESTTSLEMETVYGYQADRIRRWTVYQLAAFVILASVFSILPAALDIVEHLTTPDSPGVARWAWLLLLAGGLQIAYGIYVSHLPDWGSVWVLSLFALAMTTGYAMLLGITLLGNRESEFIQLLGIAEQLANHRASGWCLIMLGLSSLLAYISGRIAVSWRRSYRVMTGC